jgi:hypothetical protein
MRASFELKILSPNLTEAAQKAYSHMAAFIGCNPSEVLDRAEVELKVKTINTGDDKKPNWSEATDMYEVTVYGTLKQSVLRPT